ncbi:MAG: hypothetical protein V3U29_09795 [Phycisphaeraceae bacterium]
MTTITLLAAAVAILPAFANGANDNSKGVAAAFGYVAWLRLAG